MLTLVSMTYHIQFEWNVIKVIAGKEEPENNYKFLQALALAAINHVDSTNVIQRMESGDTAIVPPEPANLPSQSSSSSQPIQPQNNSNPFEQNRNPPPTIDNEQKIQNNEEEMGPRIIARPSSTIRKRPPKVYDNIANDNGRGDGSLPAGVIIEKEEEDSDDEENNNMIGGGLRNDGKATIVDNKGLHIAFAKDILDEAKNESKADDKDNKNAEGGNGEDGGGIKLGKHKRRDKNAVAGVLQVDTLRDNVQKICQSTAPLGKCMDFILDDLENMKRELLQWNEEYKRSKISLEEAKKKSEELLKPIQSKITDIDEQIKEQKQKILSQKAIITKNEARINDLLRMASKTTH